MKLIDDLKTISIRKYLVNRQILPKTENKRYGMFNAPYRDDKNPSLKVDYQQNLWYDFGIDMGGSIIDLVMKMENCSTKEAIMKLCDQHYLTGTYIKRDYTQPKPKESTIQIKKIKELEHPALLNYLQERGIDLSAAKKYCKEIHYKVKNMHFFSIGFENDKGGYELRSPIQKMSTSKDITTINNNDKICLVFEGFMNFLSYLTFHKVSTTEENVIVLNSVVNISKAESALKEHQKIFSFLDNDNTGKNALQQMRSLGLNVIDKSYLYKGFDDLNDYLMFKKGLKEQKTMKKHKL